MLTREEVIWLYRCLLGREPENEAAILGHLYVHVDLASARRAIMRSAEFDSYYRNVIADQIFYRKQIPGPYVKSKRSLALAAIVKNEEENVEEMISSCAALVRFVAIIDTMSEDRTVAKAAQKLLQLGIDHKIETVAFKDFSSARNSCLDLVPAHIDWTLMLDADERISEEDFGLFAELLDSDEKDVWSLPRYNFLDEDKLKAPAHYPDRQARLIRNSSADRLRFSGLVHESIRNAKCMGHAPESELGIDGRIGGPHIHHLGPIGRSPERNKQKSELYYRLMVEGAR